MISIAFGDATAKQILLLLLFSTSESLCLSLCLSAGVFGFDPTQPVPEGQALCSEALAACFAELDVLESTASEMGACKHQRSNLNRR